MESERMFVSAEEIERQNGYLEKLRGMIGGRGLTAHVRTYGCQQNVSDGERLKGLLTEAGYTLTDRTDEADLVLLNTCAIRENAEDRVFGNVGALKKRKRENPNMLIGVCGCMTQQPHIAERFRAHYPYVDLVFGTHALYRLPELLYRKLCDRKRVFEIENEDGRIAESLPLVRESTLKANLPILYGCNNFCTYCIVPYVRGRERSREPERILAEARELIARGYKDITLLGQNVNSYSGGKGFPDLLRRLNALEGDFVLRFMTSHPKDCTRELMDAIAACDKVSAHLHLPVQSGSNRVLQAMNRHYTVEQYLELVEYAKRTIEGLALTSDIIVGFPGETEAEFEETLKLVETVRYHSLFTFIYSPRVGTRAASMDDPISYAEKSGWFSRLLDAQAKIGQEIYSGYIGKTERVLIDGTAKQSGHLTARNDANMIVDLEGDAAEIGRFAQVKITGAKPGVLLGTLTF